MVLSLRIGHHRYVLAPGITTVGRDARSTVRLSDASVSRVHARVTVTGDQAQVEDLQSKNGTSVQGKPISAPTILVDGDEVEFGHVKGWFIVETSNDTPTTTNL